MIYLGFIPPTRIFPSYQATEHNFLLDLDDLVLKCRPEIDSGGQRIFSWDVFPDDGELEWESRIYKSLLFIFG
jgi:hypothetical protein